MAGPSEEFEFVTADSGQVLSHIERLGAAGRGWVNLQPGIAEDDEPAAQGALGALFSTAVHEVPVCTWVCGRHGRHGVEPDSVGVQHATGTKVVARLASLGVALPEGWRWVQDHPRRGLVVLTPPGTAHAEQLRWLLEAGTVLSTIALTGKWRALVYEGH
ncbi:MAG TPA: hypothetical protein VMV14_10285 [Acidimicrobiales bacterium]|nr:hypothetical protein [Acidimicrobiales bacterium]